MAYVFVYVFKRHKKTGRKKIISRMSEYEARGFCFDHNKKSSPYWYEWSRDKEYI